MNPVFIFLFSFAISLNCFGQSTDQIWPQFRGMNSSGVAAETAKPPVVLSNDNLKWKIQLPKGVSSPVIWNEKLFITGFIVSTKELQTICIDRNLGKVLWKNSIVPDTVEKVHTIGSPAQGTVVTDGERVVAYFGSFGLVCYDMNGNPIWKYRVACNNESFGHGTSPVISGEKVIYFSDVQPKRFLVSLDKKTGNVIWRNELKFPMVGNVWISSAGGHSVPCIYEDKIVLLRVGGISCYSLTDGTLLFDYKTFTAGNATPFIVNNKVVATCWYNFSEENQRGKLPGFDDLVKSNDKNQNGTIDWQEIPPEMIFYQRPEMELEQADKTVREFFWAFDTSGDKEITRQEWDAGLKLLHDFFYKPAGLMAISLDNKGELSDSCVLWRVTENIPEVPSPVCYKNRIYMIKEGGILTCVNSETGEVLYINRIGASGPIMASPIAANGNIYFFNYNGKMKVIKAGDKFEVTGEYDFKDKVAATPAVVGSTIYIRTLKELLAYTNN